MVDRIAEIWGTRTPYPQDGLWPVRVDQALGEGIGEDDVERGFSPRVCCAATAVRATSL